MGWANPIVKPRNTAPSRTIPVALPKAMIAVPVARAPTMLSKKWRRGPQASSAAPPAKDPKITKTFMNRTASDVATTEASSA